MVHASDSGERFELTDPVSMSRASAFLWNPRMVIQLNCRGFATAQFLQPEPAKYTYAPNLEAKTFMQPEQPYYAHHSGRFFYAKDEESGLLFSAPYEPVRLKTDSFVFSVGTGDVSWTVEHDGIRLELCVSLSPDEVVELWSLRVTNFSGRPRRLSVYPYIPVGYMSWMNQSAVYRADLGGIVASSVTPYQKVADYFKNKYFADKTFVLHDREPVAWEANREAFEGEGGLHNPDGISGERLANGDACYETPAAVLQYRVSIEDGGSEVWRFLVGPAFDDDEIRAKRERYFSDTGYTDSKAAYASYIARGRGCLDVKTGDGLFNLMVNRWIPRQMFYLADVNRLTTDPQTRNYLQDAMGMVWIDPAVTRGAFLHALSQQEESGAMPDGILLRSDAELKYINQIPHTDHCVWLPVCLKAYLDETGDYDLLDTPVAAVNGGRLRSVSERIDAAMRHLLSARDKRGLSYIAQGDWCDPMNMVGYRGQGVSGWLSVATAYALRMWADILENTGRFPEHIAFYRAAVDDINRSVNKYLWDGEWYGRGITDDGVVFGVSDDAEGRIYLNPQSWALLAGTPDRAQAVALMRAVETQLDTPYGPAMLAPAYTAMREDVGRVTQKYPGVAENGSVYNHAAAFWIYSLYAAGQGERAWKTLRQMIPGPGIDDYLRRGQLPVYIPNYYRGAFYQLPNTAGRSSQLFNTGTVAWLYRSLIEGLFGLKGESRGLRIEPQIPAAWIEASVTRKFRGAVFHVSYRRDGDCPAMLLSLDGVTLDQALIENIRLGQEYRLLVLLPATDAQRDGGKRENT